MLNRFGEQVKCSAEGCNASSEDEDLRAVGKFRGDHDYTILCVYHAANVMHRNPELKRALLTKDVYEGKHNLSKDYSVFSSQTHDRKAVFSNAKGLGSEGKRETNKKGE